MKQKNNTVEHEDFSAYNGDGTNLRKAQMRLLEMLLEFDRICKKHDIQYFLSGGSCLGAVRHGGFIPWDDDVDIDVWYTDYKKLLKILPNELPESRFMQTNKTDPEFKRQYMRIVDKHSKALYSDNTSRDKFKHPGLWLDILPLQKTISYRLKKFTEFLYSGSKSNLMGNKNNRLKRLASIFIYPSSLMLMQLFGLISHILAPKEKICHVYGTGMVPKLNRASCLPTKPLSFEGFELSGPSHPHNYLKSLYGENYMEVPDRSNRAFHAEVIEVFENESVNKFTKNNNGNI